MPQKTVKFEGRTLIVPEDATPDEIDALFNPPSEPVTAAPVPTPTLWEMIKRTSPGAAMAGGLIEGAAKGVASTGAGVRSLLGMEQINTPEQLEARGAAESVGKFVERGLEFAAPAGVATRVLRGAPLAFRALGQGVSASGVTGAQTGGDPAAMGVSGAIGAAVPVVGAGIGAIPSAARAGRNFERVMAQAADEPLNLNAATAAVERGRELAQRGSSMPKIFRDFTRNRAAATGDFMGVPVTEPMTYRVGRDFASNAGAQSAKEITRQNAQMQQQVTQFSVALREANREAAARVGMGRLYDEAMREYAHAATLAERMDVLRRWTIGAGLAAAGVGGLRALLD